MLTWRLWHWLSSPHTSHPLYNRLQQTDFDDTDDAKKLTRWRRATVILFTGLMVGLPIAAAFESNDLSVGFSLVAAVLSGGFTIPLYLLLNMQSVGANFAVRISRELAKLRTSGSYDLIATTPDGYLGITRAVCAGYLHRHDSFGGAGLQRGLLVHLCLSISSAGALGLALLLLPEVPTPFTITANFLAVTLLLVTDFAQAILLGVLFGAVAAGLAKKPFDVAVLASSLFLLVQITGYTGGAVLFALYPGTQPIDPTALFLSLLTILALLYVQKEAVIFVLWRRLVMQVNATPDELPGVLST